MICSGCGAVIKLTNGWLCFSHKRELYLGDHIEIATEVEAVACSWVCLCAVVHFLRTDRELPDEEEGHE